MLVDVVIEDPRWQEAVLSPLAERACSAALGHLGHDPALFEISLLACDDDRIRALNRDHRGKDAPTNVLSWPAWDLSSETPGALPDAPEPGTVDDPEGLGDIALAYDTCLREAIEQGKWLDDHVGHLIVHSLLHLLGYDHETDPDAATMEETEVAILAKLGIADPYAADDPDAPDRAAGVD